MLDQLVILTAHLKQSLIALGYSLPPAMSFHNNKIKQLHMVWTYVVRIMRYVQRQFVPKRNHGVHKIDSRKNYHINFNQLLCNAVIVRLCIIVLIYTSQQPIHSIFFVSVHRTLAALLDKISPLFLASIQSAINHAGGEGASFDSAVCCRTAKPSPPVYILCRIMRTVHVRHVSHFQRRQTAL